MNKYVLYVSILLNGILLIILFGIVPFFLYLSILINLGMAWFIKRALEENSDLEDDMEELMNRTSNFVDHIEGMHELEMYYGDENLQNMIRHSKEVTNDIIDFQLKYFDTEEDFDPEPEEELQKEEEEQLLHEDS